VTKAQYLELLNRMQKAKLGQDAESSSSGVVLEVLNPPTASVKPVAPRRPLLVSVVFLLGLGAAAALAIVLSKINVVFNHARELEQATGLEVVGIISLSNLDQVEAQERRSYQRYAAAVAGLVVAFLLVLLFSRGVPGLLA
jgi:capsular polysaccharide biosynthesis protein